MSVSVLPAALAVGSGGVVGLVLGLVGGGGSILAVPLLVYLVGMPSTHVAIGTAALAVAANAMVGLASQARIGAVRWRCATVFALAGIAGTGLGAMAGKAMDGERLLAVFGLAMIGVGLSMLRGGAGEGDADVRLTRETAPVMLPWLLTTGFGVGLLSGFFGIGGGFLIVPSLMLATGMPIGHAIATSLVAVTAFGLTTSLNYAATGLVSWTLAAEFIIGGVLGGYFGARASELLAERRGTLNLVFSGLIFTTAGYVLARSLGWQ